MMGRMLGDPFDILGVAARFDLSLGEIERAYLERAAREHPDSKGGQRADGQAWGGDAMSALNEAREVMRDPERRANALLARLGGPSAQDVRALPEGYLMEVMETRERIESILKSGGQDARERVEREAREARSGHEREAARLFASLGDPPEPELLRQIRVRLNAWRYVERLIEQLDPSFDPRRGDPR